MHEPNHFTSAKYLVFLDIDGVFTSNRVEITENTVGLLWSKFDPIAMNFMNRIHDSHEKVEFVLISTWRDGVLLNDAHANLWIVTALRNAGFRGDLAYPLWKVNPYEDAELYQLKRAHETKHYLDNFAPYHKDFIIFDDTDYDFEGVLGKRRLIKTDSNDGLLFKHMKNALSIMGTWDKK